MPKWPAWVMAGIAVACAYPALTTPPPLDPAREVYSARGNDPGWRVAIGEGRIEYVDHAGKTVRIDRPTPHPSINGRRYEAQQLVVDVSYTRCNDDLSGHGFEHQVLVIADDQARRGCGGPRRTDWDI